jgi:hypothetical protein
LTDHALEQLVEARAERLVYQNQQVEDEANIAKL